MLVEGDDQYAELLLTTGTEKQTFHTTATSEKSKPTTVNVTMDGVEVPLQVDTGAAASVLPA